jgi:2-methylaconitate cis-trans-isomerase PrpF
VPVEGGKVKVAGDFAIDGVPGTGARIELNWSDMVGANTGKLLPTGNVKDVLEVEGIGKLTVSIVDVGNPGVFVLASDVGMKGIESPDEIDANAELLRKGEAIAKAAAEKIKHLVLVTFVSAPRDYTNYVTGATVKADQADVLVRMLLMGKTHKTYAASMINCCGSAAMIPGTVVNEVAPSDLTNRTSVRMGHPSGVADLEGIETEKTATGVNVKKIIVNRTARRLMEGYSFVMRDLLP